MLEGENAVLAWREFVGPTDPDVAREKAPHSIRAMFGTGGSHNAIHGSDSIDASKREIALVFGDSLDQKPVALPIEEPAQPKQPMPPQGEPTNKGRRSVTSLKRGMMSGSRVASVQMLNDKSGKSYTPMGSTGSLAAGKTGKVGSTQSLRMKPKSMGGSRILGGSKASLRKAE